MGRAPIEWTPMERTTNNIDRDKKITARLTEAEYEALYSIIGTESVSHWVRQAIANYIQYDNPYLANSLSKEKRRGRPKGSKNRMFP